MIFSASIGRGADFDLGTHGKLSVSVPEDWGVNGKSANTPEGKALGYTFAFKPRNDANAKCLLTFVYQTNGATSKDAVRQEVLRITKAFVADSVEKKQDLKDFTLESGYGTYCLFTDASLVGKKAEPGDYKVMGSGRIQLDKDVGAVVSMFADDANGGEMKAMLKILNSLKLKSK
jgi:hypothetical protein